MRIILEYDDDDRAEAQRAIKATDYGLMLWAMCQWLIEGVNADYSAKEIAVYQRVLEKHNELMERYGVDYPE